MFESLVKKLTFKFSFLYQTFPNYTCKICNKKKNFMFFIDDTPVCPECLPTFFEKEFLPLLISKVILALGDKEIKDA
ncbi:MAG: hypothetical protein CBR30_06300 [Dictyoglomus sp. NZ13-RE01]|nr:MAG: hypothetical protein CBR30_06300 [Dictyoglomus sp. NZ13-RE01]